MGHSGEINVDQAHRGYNMADDGNGYKSINPLFMKYTPTDGSFSGQSGYGYKSFEVFINAAIRINKGEAEVKHFEHSLAAIGKTFCTTAILEAGRKSLDSKKMIRILYEDTSNLCLPTSFEEMS